MLTPSFFYQFDKSYTIWKKEKSKLFNVYVLDTQQAEYHVIATVVYRANGAVAPACLPEYTHLMSNYYQQLNEILSQRCSAVNVNMNVSFINEKPQLLEDNLVQVLITDNPIN